MADPMLIPALPPGATLALIAPAGRPRPETLPRVPALLEAHGFQAKLMPSVAGPAPLNYLAADDERRLADLHAAYADPEVAAVMCLRGGYGCARILDRIDTGLLRRHPHKLLIGYSDISSLIGLLDHLGLPSLHAPMPSSDLLAPEGGPDAQALVARLRQGLRRGERLAAAQAGAGAPQALDRPGRARGRLIGGNLAVFTALLGTPWAPCAEGAILFLEDVSEALSSVSRSSMASTAASRSTSVPLKGSAADCACTLRPACPCNTRDEKAAGPISSPSLSATAREISLRISRMLPGQG